MCGITENCTFSADKAWIVRQNENGGVMVSRPDGTDATTLFRGGVEDVPLLGYRFVNQHTVEYHGGSWGCDCSYFRSHGTCSHTMAMDRVLGVMAPEV